MKISFDIKYRPQIESGEYKVETKEGCQVEILKFGIKSTDYHIAGIIHRISFDEVVIWTNNGMFHTESFKKESPHDLVLITPELELTESKEDERIRKAIRLILIATEDDQKDFYSTHGLTRKDCTDWLESLRNRPMISDIWKPSVEQLKVLKEAIFYFGDSWVFRKHQVLQSLYEDLMKV